MISRVYAGSNQVTSATTNAVVGRARFELAVSWSQTRRFAELSYRPPLETHAPLPNPPPLRGEGVIQTDRRSSAPEASIALTARARWLYRAFSSGLISPNVRPDSGTRNTGS
jgi:hypothetical protein